MLVFTDDRKKGQTSVRFSFPCGVAVDQDDNIFITDTNNKRIVQMSRGGKFLKEIAPGGKKYFIALCILFLRNNTPNVYFKIPSFKLYLQHFALLGLVLNEQSIILTLLSGK